MPDRSRVLKRTSSPLRAGPRARLAFALRVSFALLAALSAAALSAHRAEAAAYARVQLGWGGDNNVFERIEKPAQVEDHFLRTLAEVEFSRETLPMGGRGALGLRGFSENYSQEPHESRAQGEARLSTEFPLRRNGALLRVDGGYSARSYPDSSRRDFRRAYVGLQGSVPLGPTGGLRPTLRVTNLDFKRTPRRDQLGIAFDLSYEQPVVRGILAGAGLEITNLRHGRASIRWNEEGGEEVGTEFGPDQRDNSRFLHVGARWVRRWAARVEYGFRMQESNSLGSSYHRHEFRWLFAAPLPARFSAQLYGNLEHTHYTDEGLDRIYVIRAGEEEEAGDDNNTVALGLSRPVARSVRVESRVAWYRNESLLEGEYYRKRVWSLGLSWETGRPSGF